MCTRPSWCTPMSTNAPNAVTFDTTPSSCMPSCRSLIASTPSWNVAVLNSGRGSRPGFSSSARMSVTVGTPNFSSVKSFGFSLSAAACGRRAGASRPCRSSAGCARRPGRPRGARRCCRAGSRRRAHAGSRRHCSNAFGPRRVTFSSSLRVRNGPFASRCATMFFAIDADRPATRLSRASLAVLRSTPTWFTQSSTTSRATSRAGLVHVVLVLADADRLRVDLHQFGERILQAARDRHRPAQRHVELGELARGDLAGRVDRGAGFADDELLHAEFGQRLIRSAASLSVSREAVPLPIEISATPCCLHSTPSVCSEPSQSSRGTCG
jgi:hypothetical protein